MSKSDSTASYFAVFSYNMRVNKACKPSAATITSTYENWPCFGAVHYNACHTLPTSSTPALVQPGFWQQQLCETPMRTGC
eukprot:3237769-Amphidinium_carterae.1